MNTIESSFWYCKICRIEEFGLFSMSDCWLLWLFGYKYCFYLALFIFENVRVTKLIYIIYALFRMNFYPVASNLPPSMIFVFADSSYFDNFN